MALSVGTIILGRALIFLLLVTQMTFLCSDLLFLCFHWGLLAGLLVILIELPHAFVAFSFSLFAGITVKRRYYSDAWFGYTFLLIGDIILEFILIKDPEQSILLGPTALSRVLCITPFVLLLFVNTAGEGGTEFHGESRWLFATMIVQIFDAIDMIDNVWNRDGNGIPKEIGMGMTALAFGFLLLASFEFLELTHYSPESENIAKIYRLILATLLNLVTLVCRAVVSVDYGWRETTSIAKNIIMIYTSITELRRMHWSNSSMNMSG